MYKVYKSESGGTFTATVLPIDAAGKGYGALEFAKDGSLIAYVYDSKREDEPEYTISRDGGRGDGLVLYHSADGIHWDEGQIVDRRPKGGGTGYYSNLLPIYEPGKPPRVLLQYSHVYDRNRVNIAHRTITS